MSMWPFRWEWKVNEKKKKRIVFLLFFHSSFVLFGFFISLLFLIIIITNQTFGIELHTLKTEQFMVFISFFILPINRTQCVLVLLSFFKLVIFFWFRLTFLLIFSFSFANKSICVSFFCPNKIIWRKKLG